QVENVWTLRHDSLEQLLLGIAHPVGGPRDQDRGVVGRDSLRSVRSCGFARLSPIRDETGYHAALATIALFPDFLVKTRGVVAAFVPALLQIVGKLVHLRWRTVRRFSFWKLVASQPAADG